MPRAFEQDDNGRYQTEGLNNRDFSRVFNEIARNNADKRKRAKRTMTPGILSRGKRNSVQDIVRLGRKPDGTLFTLEELKRFDQIRKKFKKRGGGLAGVTYLELVGRSSTVRIDRASGRTNDRRSISRAQLISLKANTVEIRVGASQRSVHQEHRVKVRFEQWGEFMADANGQDKGYEKATKRACAGRMSFDCDCGDHQYRYRYMATIGNYGIAPPKEWAFPKIRNPNLGGLACKHVLLAATKLQSPVWQKALAKQMTLQANKAGYGDDKRSGKLFGEEDEKELNKNRKNTINAEKVKAAWGAYKARQKAAAAKIKNHKAEIDKLRKKATKARKSATKSRAEADKLRKENAALKKQAAAILRDKMKLQFQSFADAFAIAGMTRDQAMKAFSKKAGVPVSQLKEIIK